MTKRTHRIQPRSFNFDPIPGFSVRGVDIEPILQSAVRWQCNGFRSWRSYLGLKGSPSIFALLSRDCIGDSSRPCQASFFPFFRFFFSNTTGSDNTASGSGALRDNTTGSGNTASGVEALASNTTGEENTASGSQALLSNTTGRENTAIGTLALTSNITGIDNTASGSRALLDNTTGGQNTAVGKEALGRNMTGSFNTAVGSCALDRNETGNNNTAIGFQADVLAEDLTNATAIGFRAVVDASNKIRLGNTAVTVVEGPPYSTVSDKTKKENFQSVDGEVVLRKIRGLSVTSWNFIGHDPKQFRHYGPTAQDFFAAFGHDGIGTIGTPTTITSGDMDGILMIAAQALERRTAELRQEEARLKETVEALQAENAELKARLEALERRIGR